MMRPWSVSLVKLLLMLLLMPLVSLPLLTAATTCEIAFDDAVLASREFSAAATTREITADADAPASCELAIESSVTAAHSTVANIFTFNILCGGGGSSNSLCCCWGFTPAKVAFHLQHFVRWWQKQVYLQTLFKDHGIMNPWFKLATIATDANTVDQHQICAEPCATFMTFALVIFEVIGIVAYSDKQHCLLLSKNERAALTYMCRSILMFLKLEFLS